MMKTDIVSLLVFCGMLMGLGLSVQGQQPQSNDYWFNVASSPLQIVVVSNPTREDQIREILENISKGSITEFQLGCVRLDGGTFEVVDEKSPEKIQIAPVSSDGSKLFLPKGSHGGSLSVCRHPTKVTVVAVKFADGGKWTVK